MIGIEAIGSYLPSLEESNYSRLKKFNVEKEFIENKTGFRYLRKALEGEKTSDLCLRAFEDLDSIIKYYSDNIVNDSSLTNNIYKEQVQSFQLDSTKSNKTYYVIIGSFKEFKNAMDFKQIFIREYNLESKILTDKNKSWYYLYTNSSSNIDSLRGRLKELQAIDVKKIISENPWIYFE